MAQLQCLQSVKSRRRVASHISVEACASATSPHFGRRKTQSKNKLYEIDIIEEKGSQVKVHYTGYGNEYDEWKEKSEIVYSKPSFPPDDPNQPISPLTELACAIKKKLVTSRSEDPDVRIQISCDPASFKSIQDRSVTKCHGRYGIANYHDLDDLLGERWYYRIANPIGDFSYIIIETLNFHLHTSRPILDYEVETSTNGSLTFNPVYIEQTSSIVCSFVRGDGNRKKLEEFMKL